jgi:hypothetical protein
MMLLLFKYTIEREFWDGADFVTRLLKVGKPGLTQKRHRSCSAESGR